MENDNWDGTIKKLKSYELDQSYFKGYFERIDCDPEGLADFVLELVSALKTFEDQENNELTYELRNDSELYSF